MWLFQLHINHHARMPRTLGGLFEFSLSMERFINTRKEQQTLTPVYLSAGPGEELPEFMLVPQSRADSYERNYLIHFTAQGNEQFMNMREQVVQRREQLDAVVQKLAEQNDLFGWKNMGGGCVQSTDLIYDYLTVMGVPKKSISILYLIRPKETSIPAIDFDGELISWFLHAGLEVTLQDGTQWVLDPKMDSTRVIARKEWITGQVVKPGMINFLGKMSASFTYDRSSSFLFQTDPDCAMDHDRQKRSVSIEFKSEAHKRENKQQLAAIRDIIEMHGVNLKLLEKLTKLVNP